MAKGPSRAHELPMAVIRQAHVAMLTRQYIVTPRAGHEPCIASSIHQQDSLLPTAQRLAQLLFQPSAQDMQTLASLTDEEFDLLSLAIDQAQDDPKS